ncbi:hypothetical protein SCUP234_08305 [Seiridium cupressi]
MQQSEQAEQQIVAQPRVSWESKKSEVDDFLKDCTENAGSMAAYLISPHASGKSTSLPIHMLVHTMETQTGPLIYVPSREQEAKSVFRNLVDFKPSLKEFITYADDGEGLATELESGDLVVCSYDDFVDWATEPTKTSFTILADVELRATVSGELFFGKLIELAQPKPENPVMNIILLDARISGRTRKGFDKWNVPLRLIEVQGQQPSPRVKRPGDDWKATMSKAIQETEGQVVAVLESMDELIEQDVLIIDRLNLCNQDGGGLCVALPADKIVNICPDLSIKGRCRNLTLLLSHGQAVSLVLDEQIRQLVCTTRKLSHHELLREESWVLQSDNELEKVRYISCSPAPSGRNSDNAPSDPTQSAWNQDLSYLVLRMVEMWPNVHVASYPICPAPDPAFLIEEYVRLGCLSCLEPGERDGEATLTSRGRTTLGVVQNMRSSDSPGIVPFEMAHFLASVNSVPDVKVKRVIILMALLIYRGELRTDTFCYIRKAPSRAVIDKRCAGIGHKLAKRGWLWGMLGVYLKHLVNGDFQVVSAPIVADGLAVSPAAGRLITEQYGNLEYLLGLSPIRDPIADTDLNDEQVAMVEWELAFSYQHRTAFHFTRTNRQDSWSDAYSSCDVGIDRDREFLDFDGIKDMTEADGGYLAIYLLLEPHQAQSYICRALTYIPRNNIIELGRRQGGSWPQCLVTSVPRRR